MNIRDEIAKVAHDLYLKRGCAHGYHVDDWLEAERIVMARHAKAKPAEKTAEAPKPKRGRKSANAPEEKESKPARRTSTKGTTTTRKKKTE